MYLLTMNGKEKKVKAEGMSIEAGSILFFKDKESAEVVQVISPGKWDSIEVTGDSQPLRVRPVVQPPKEDAPKEPVAGQVA